MPCLSMLKVLAGKPLRRFRRLCPPTWSSLSAVRAGTPGSCGCAGRAQEEAAQGHKLLRPMRSGNAQNLPPLVERARRSMPSSMRATHSCGTNCVTSWRLVHYRQLRKWPGPAPCIGFPCARSLNESNQPFHCLPGQRSGHAGLFSDRSDAFRFILGAFR